MAELSTEELERIERVQAAWPGGGYPGAHGDARALLAEVKRLRAEQGRAVVDMHALLSLLADAADPGRAEFRITREGAEDRHPYAMALVKIFANKLRSEGGRDG